MPRHSSEGAARPRAKTAHKRLKHSRCSGRRSGLGGESWTSIQKTAETAGPMKRRCSRGFRDGPLGHMFLSRGRTGEEEPKGDEERAGKTSAHADHPSPGSSKVSGALQAARTLPGDK